jgi:multiple antibiotic resistance protein
MPLAPNALSAFVTLLVTIGPIETAVVFASLTSAVHRPERRSLALRSIVVAGAMLLLFALGGEAVLGLLRVSLAAFRVAGGLLLFLQALTLTFASPGLSSISEGEQTEARRPGDIAVFPLAFPVIAGPGSLSAVVLVMGAAKAWATAPLWLPCCWPASA